MRRMEHKAEWMDLRAKTLASYPDGSFIGEP